MERRWGFKRYDHRGHGISHSRGWLHYVGLGQYLLVLGFHRGVVNGWGYDRIRTGKPRAWLEFTFYGRKQKGHSAYPGIRIPRRWL
jgi:hypothetical protein